MSVCYVISLHIRVHIELSANLLFLKSESKKIEKLVKLYMDLLEKKIYSGENWESLVLIVTFSRFGLFSGRIFVITIRNNFLEKTFLVETTKKTFLFLLTPISP